MPGHFTHIYTARRVADWLAGQEVFNPSDQGDSVFPLAGSLSGIDPAEAARVMKEWPRFTATGAIGPDLFFFCQDYGSGPLAKSPYEDDALMLAMAIAYWVDAAADNDYAPIIALLAEINTTFAQVVRFLLQLEQLWKDFLQAWNATIGPIVSAANSVLDDVTGGLVSAAGDAIDAYVAAIKQVVLQQLTTFADIFSWFSLKMRQGWDEQSFVWSDMLHYRRTTEMARNLLAEADRQFGEDGDAVKRDQFRAFALGWICHIGTDVVAHSFVNEQAGGPFRTHWQRHHLVENHIDAWNYRQAGPGGTLPADPDIAATPDYPDLGQSALHFAVAMNAANPNGWPRPASPDDTSVDKDGELPDWLAEGIVRALIATYHDKGDIEPANLMGDAFYGSPLADALTRAGDALATAGINLSQPIGDLLHQVAPQPSFHVPAGYPLPWEVKVSYRFMITYYKKAFWGSFDLNKPRAPQVIIWPPASDWSNLASAPDLSGASSGDPVDDVCDAIAAFIDWLGKELEGVGQLVGDIIKALASPASYPLRLLLYELAMIAWDITSGAHDVLAHIGFVIPHGEQVYPDNGELKLANEIDQGLISLGHNLDASFLQALADAADPFGNLDGGITGSLHNPRDPRYPFLPVRGKQLPIAPQPPLNLDPNVTEFHRPWAYPGVSRSSAADGHLYATPTEVSDIVAECQQAQLTEQQQAAVERALGPAAGTVSGPYPAGATPDQVLFQTDRPVPVDERGAYENATTPAITDLLNIELIGTDAATDHNPLGDPIQFSAYLMGQVLSTADYDVNFNLDSDRGFGYRCWDWIRDSSEPPHTALNGRNQSYVIPVVAPEGCPLKDSAPAWHGAPPDSADDKEISVQLRYLLSPGTQPGDGGGGGGGQLG